MKLSNVRKIEMPELHKHFYECLSYFDCFCEKNKLTYIVMWGSLLGCVRDGEIIPWDGDVDLAMPFQDYDKLKLLKSSFDNDRYELTFPPLQKRTYSNEIRIKINNVFWEQKNQIGNYDRRVAIDIFLSTPLSDNAEQNRTLASDYRKIVRKLYLKFDCFGHSNNFKKILHFFISKLLFFLGDNYLHKKATKIERRFIECNSNNFWFCPQDGSIISFPRTFFDNIERKKFGPITVNCPSEGEIFLKKAYGDDWRIPLNRNKSNDFEEYYMKEQ